MIVFSVYAPHSGESDEEKENFWNFAFQLVSGVSLDEMVVYADDMNGHVWRISTGYADMLVCMVDLAMEVKILILSTMRSYWLRGLQPTAAQEPYDGQHSKLLWRRCC